jgi:hypothetical protein
MNGKRPRINILWCGLTRAAWRYSHKVGIRNIRLDNARSFNKLMQDRGRGYLDGGRDGTFRPDQSRSCTERRADGGWNGTFEATHIDAVMTVFTTACKALK